MRQTLTKLLELALSHLATFAFPLVFAVVCGRTLGLHNYGIVAFYTALASFVGMLVEFGFDWLGVREVAQNVERPAHCHMLLCNVTAARLLVWAVLLLPLIVGLVAMRGTADAPLIGATIAYLFGFAFDATWYLRAFERTRMLLAINAVLRLAGIAALLAVVTRPDDMSAALWVYAALSIGTSAVMWAALFAGGLARFAPLDMQRIWGLLRSSWAILLGNVNGAFLTNGGLALLGSFAEPSTTGAASLALRVKLAGQAAILPLLQLGYVRLAALARTQPTEALRVARWFLVGLMAASCVVAVAMAWGAEAISRAVFRETVPVTVGLIMLLALTVPMHSAGSLFGVQGLVGFGHERAYAVVLCLASLLFAALLFGLLASPLGYGWALLAGEAFVAAGCGLALRRVLARRLAA